jgi:hypothetical protein
MECLLYVKSEIMCSHSNNTSVHEQQQLANAHDCKQGSIWEQMDHETMGQPETLSKHSQ